MSFSLCQSDTAYALSAIVNQSLVLPFPTLWLFYSDSTYGRVEWSLIVQAIPAHCGGDVGGREGSLEAPISGPLYMAPQPGLPPQPTPAALLLNNSLGIVV